MNKLKQLFFISLVITAFAFSACDKPQNIITGKITDLSTGEALSDVNIDIYGTQMTSGAFSSTFDKMFSTTTNSSGEYLLEFEPTMVGEFKIIASKKGYHNNEIFFTPEETAGEYNKDLTLPKAGYIKYTIRNAYGVYSGNEDDIASVRVDGVNPLCNTCCGSDLMVFNGLDVYEEGVWNVVAGEEVTITQTLKRINVDPMPRSRKFTCQQGDTLEYIWNY